VRGILVQPPLPKQIDEGGVIRAVALATVPGVVGPMTITVPLVRTPAAEFIDGK
jgi:5,10-methylene-tetrahydrofolate dehydrogenase/methenyl tetrahydrofolate cyclohydrolase